MCGIAGYVGGDAAPAQREADLVRMCGAIRHRGPDDEGHRVTPDVALGMRRLRIIDVEGGDQPISNETGTVHVVFNGEIYNHRLLRGRLEATGHRFATQSDTEVLVHLYEEMGERLVHELRGMFAFAIWDDRRERLLLARDRLGIKPLSYWPRERGIAFASELRSLLALRELPREVDRAAIAEFLAFGHITERRSPLVGVRKLPPGHLLVWDAIDGIREQQYWSPVRSEQPVRDDREAVEELRRLLADAVASHLESEVPLGAFLSGGVDSSAVVAQMARVQGRAVSTFSIGFDEAAFNELPDAALVARELGTNHTALVVRPDADALIDEVVHAFDEPFADPSALPTYLAAQLARQHVTVALSGDGGDELFGGYTRYEERLRRWELRPELLRRAIGAAASRAPHTLPGRNRLLDLARTRRGRYATAVASAIAPALGGVARDELVALSPSLDAVLDPWFELASGRDFATQVMMVDTMTYLPSDILSKVDRTTMAVSLEARVPLLDHPLVEFAMALPSRLKLRDGVGKWILREAIAPQVPARVLEKPKQGFAVPIDRWMRKELRHRVEWLLRPDSPIYEFVDPEAVRRVCREHQRGRRDHGAMLWRLLVLDIWLRSLSSGRLADASVHRLDSRGYRYARTG